jgi:hypothetical protein
MVGFVSKLVQLPFFGREFLLFRDVDCVGTDFSYALCYLVCAEFGVSLCALNMYVCCAPGADPSGARRRRRWRGF